MGERSIADVLDAAEFNVSDWIIGAMYHVPWSPNPHRLEAIRPQHCQLHGEFIGYELLLRKRRNSETRPWGSLSCASPKQDIRLWEAEAPHA